jgi:hypothetical protein
MCDGGGILEHRSGQVMEFVPAFRANGGQDRGPY